MRSKGRFLVPLLLGVTGCAILVSLGVWQLNRQAWKNGILAEMEARIAGDAIALPDAPEIGAHRFMPVRVTGSFDGSDIPVFLSHDGGPIYRLVAAFETGDGRRIMIDRGGVPARTGLSDEVRTAPASGIEVVGNLHWPDEVDDWTPEPDDTGVFYGRDLPRMADQLNTEPVLVVAREISPNASPGTPLPVTTDGIPNNHLGYAVQWFGLAIVWAGMTLFLLWRTANRND